MGNKGRVIKLETQYGSFLNHSIPWMWSSWFCGSDNWSDASLPLMGYWKNIPDCKIWVIQAFAYFCEMLFVLLWQQCICMPLTGRLDYFLRGLVGIPIHNWNCHDHVMWQLLKKLGFKKLCFGSFLIYPIIPPTEFTCFCYKEKYQIVVSNYFTSLCSKNYLELHYLFTFI